MESKYQIKLDIGKITDSEIFDYKPAFKPDVKIAQNFEAELLRFADHFKTRRVYVVQWHKDNNFRLDFCYKYFKYEDRAIAYDVARHSCVHS